MINDAAHNRDVLVDAVRHALQAAAKGNFDEDTAKDAVAAGLNFAVDSLPGTVRVGAVDVPVGPLAKYVVRPLLEAAVEAIIEAARPKRLRLSIEDGVPVKGTIRD